ncbi:MAG: acylneuraminate cytidylyltransferase family protein [Anaerolineaceae bacterium]
MVTARGGSKSIPGKNVKLLAGKPLVRWTIDEAHKSRLISRLLVSTDDEEIRSVSLAGGAEVPFLRPVEIAGDTSPHIDVMIHTLDWLKNEQDYQPEYVLLLQPTSPFRTVQDIDGVICMAMDNPEADALIGVCEAQNHPFLIKKLDSRDRLEDYFQSDLAYLRRQDLPPAYVINGAIYLNKPSSLRRERKMVPPGSLAYVMPKEHSLDVDTPWDFHLAELIMNDRVKNEND